MPPSVQGKHEGKSFSGETIELDGSSFLNCTFRDCTFIYSGGEIPSLSGCDFGTECQWQFGGEAANTIAYMSGMYQGGFDMLIENTFHAIRKGAMIMQEKPQERLKTNPETQQTSKTKSLLKPLRVFKIPK